MRSLLIVRPESLGWLTDALASGADGLLIDVAAVATHGGRSIAADFLASMRGAAVRPRLFVRIAALGTGACEADLDAIAPAAPDGVAAQGGESGPAVQRLAAKLAVREAQNGLAEGATRILARVESARGLLALPGLVDASPRLCALALSLVDFQRDFPEGANGPPQRARESVALAAAAIGTIAIDAAYPDPADMGGLGEACRRAKFDGYSGKMANDARHIELINRIFTRA